MYIYIYMYCAPGPVVSKSFTLLTKSRETIKIIGFWSRIWHAFP